MNLWAGLKGLFGAGGATQTAGAVLATIDALHTSAEEKATLRMQIVDAQARVLVAEAQAGGLAATWRPIMMMSFGAMLWWYTLSATFGWPPPDLYTVPDRLWGLMELGVGAYIGGRSLEKIVETVVPLKRRK